MYELLNTKEAIINNHTYFVKAWYMMNTFQF